jgi:hypothetical protein
MLAVDAAAAIWLGLLGAMRARRALAAIQWRSWPARSSFVLWTTAALWVVTRR